MVFFQYVKLFYPKKIPSLLANQTWHNWDTFHAFRIAQCNIVKSWEDEELCRQQRTTTNIWSSNEKMVTQYFQQKTISIPEDDTSLYILAFQRQKMSFCVLQYPLEIIQILKPKFAFFFFPAKDSLFNGLQPHKKLLRS